MISQILGFSVLFILVFGGIIEAILKFTLQGSVQANLSNRIQEARIKDALKQTDVKPDMESRKNLAPSARDTIRRVDDEYSKLQPPA